MALALANGQLTSIAFEDKVMHSPKTTDNNRRLFR
jgi:hypothetical protein